MKHIKTLTTRDLKESMKKGGCGECQTSCQSACKTSCTVGNQSCENVKENQQKQHDKAENSRNKTEKITCLFHFCAHLPCFSRYEINYTILLIHLQYTDCQISVKSG